MFFVALVYGLSPNVNLKWPFDFEIYTVTLSSIFRSLMGLYMAIAVFWFIGIMKSKFWVAATISNILFMGGLAFGRIISLIFDGKPSEIFIAGLALEIILSSWGLINLKKYKNGATSGDGWQKPEVLQR